MSRLLQTKFSVHKKLLERRVIEKSEYKTEKYKENYIKYYDTKTKDKSEFKKGDTMATREKYIWVPGVVLEKI